MKMKDEPKEANSNSTDNSDDHDDFDPHIDEFAKPRLDAQKVPFKIRVKNAFKGLTWKTWFWFSIIMFVVGFTVFALIEVIRDPSWIFKNVMQIITPIIKIEGWGFALFIVFMALQGVMLVGGEVMLLTSGLIWGTWVGAGIGQVGLFLAAVVSYEIGIRGGKPVAERFIGEDLYVFDFYMMKYGNPTLLLTRAIPAFPYEVISFAAGFLGIRRRDYYLLTFIGSIPRCLFYAFVGAQLRPEDGNLDSLIQSEELLNEFIQAGTAKFNIIIIWAIVIIGAGFVIYKFWLSKYLKWKRVQHEISELDEEGHLEEYGFSKHTIQALVDGEIPAKAHKVMGFFTITDEEGNIMLRETIEVMNDLILGRKIPDDMDDIEIHYPDASSKDRLWLRLAKNYRLLLKDVFESKDADMIAHFLEGLGHCYYKLGHKEDAGGIFEKSKIIYHQAGEKEEAKRVDKFLESHFPGG
jgi:uncharacterized membrane protein YdjX (TVP38/TMEM64 family)